MKFSLTFPILSGLLATASAATQAPHDVFGCNDLGTGCQLVYDIHSDVHTCSCVANDNGALPHLGDFYTKDTFHGYLWRGYGDYGSCINLPKFWAANSESFKSDNGPNPTVCCIYTDYNCNTVGRDSQQIDGDGTVQEFVGYYEDGVYSMRCSLREDETSKCTDDLA